MLLTVDESLVPLAFGIKRGTIYEDRLPVRVVGGEKFASGIGKELCKDGSTFISRIYILRNLL